MHSFFQRFDVPINTKHDTLELFPALVSPCGGGVVEVKLPGALLLQVRDPLKIDIRHFSSNRQVVPRTTKVIIIVRCQPRVDGPRRVDLLSLNRVELQPEEVDLSRISHPRPRRRGGLSLGEPNALERRVIVGIVPEQIPPQ